MGLANIFGVLRDDHNFFTGVTFFEVSVETVNLISGHVSEHCLNFLTSVNLVLIQFCYKFGPPGIKDYNHWSNHHGELL